MIIESKYPANFSREELLHSTTAIRHGINNTPVSEEHEANLLTLAHFLQKLRNALSAYYQREIAIIVYSGYRSHSLNTLVRGSKRSAHCFGLAADIRCVSLTPSEVCQFIKDNKEIFEFDQVINEFDGWTHIGLLQPKTGKQRHQFLKAEKVSGRTSYHFVDEYL